MKIFKTTHPTRTPYRAALRLNTHTAYTLSVWTLLLTITFACAPANAAPGRDNTTPADNSTYTRIDHGDRGMMDAVAERSSEWITQVRGGANSLVDFAMQVLGVRYKRGGNTTESGFDCSGFTRYVFEHSIGRVLPHRADEQANAPELVKVDPTDLKPGDLVFFNTLRRTFSHVGIYLGDGKFIHSPRSGQSVRIEDMNIAYWARHFTGARRAPELETTSSVSSASTSPSGILAAMRAHAAALGSRPASAVDELSKQ